MEEIRSEDWKVNMAGNDKIFLKVALGGVNQTPSQRKAVWVSNLRVHYPLRMSYRTYQEVSKQIIVVYLIVPTKIIYVLTNDLRLFTNQII